MIAERDRANEERAAKSARDDALLQSDFGLRSKIIRANLADATRLAPKSSAWLAYQRSARVSLDRFRGTKLASTPAWTDEDKALIELATLGCTRVGPPDQGTLEICCPAGAGGF